MIPDEAEWYSMVAAQAHMVAVFYRALCDAGVDAPTALTLTATWIQAVGAKPAMAQPPKPGLGSP